MGWLKKIKRRASDEARFRSTHVFGQGVNSICGKGVKSLDNLQHELFFREFREKLSEEYAKMEVAPSCR